MHFKLESAEPILPYLTEYKNIVIAPHSILHAIPLGALRKNKNSDPICNQYTVTLASSISLLSAIYKQSEKWPNAMNSKLLSVVYAGTNPKERNYLRNVEDESIIASQSFNETIKLARFDATPENVITHANDETFEAIHFGCHGHFDINDPDYSGLKINGTLNAQIIINRIRFRGSPLVTLAACQTGLVEQYSSGDLTGLTQSFFIAGARNVVATLWPINDVSTKELLGIFYKKRKEAGITNSEALQFAVNEIRINTPWKSPLYWAAFQILGLPL